MLKGLGIKPEIRAVLIEEVNVILNSAASVNFMEPLRDALQHNYFGALRILDLAHECKNLVSMVHVSSAYVNVNQPSFSTVPEALMPPKVEPEEYINKLTAMNPSALEIETPTIIQSFGFPNTYSFSKNMAEHVLGKRRGNLRLAILRPSSILACHSQPFPGWVDSIGTAGGLHVPMGMGLSDTFNLRPKPYSNTVVPCDLCCNGILVTAMKAARTPEPQLSVFHCTTSGRAKAEIYGYFEDSANYLKHNPWDSAVTENVGFKTVYPMSEWYKYKVRKYDVPAKAMKAVSVIPIPALKKLGKQADLILKVGDKIQKIEEGYKFFREREWVFDDEQYCRVCDELNEHDKVEFMMDIRKVDFSGEGRKY